MFYGNKLKRLKKKKEGREKKNSEIAERSTENEIS